MCNIFIWEPQGKRLPVMGG